MSITTIRAEAPQLLLSLIRSPEDYQAIVDSGLVPNDFGQLSRVMEFIREYRDRKGVFPDRSLLDHQFPSVLVEVTADLDFAIEEMKKWVIERRVEEALTAHVGGEIDLTGLIARLEEAKTLNPRYESVRYSDASVVERFEKWREYRDHPHAQTLLRGIRTGLPTLDKTRFGFEPGDFITIFGRPETGKSWLLANFGVTSWVSGHRVLYVSPEMSPQQVELRLDTLIAGQKGIYVSNRQMRLGEGIKEDEFQKLIELQHERKDFRIEERLPVEEIRSIVLEEKPKVVLIDGAYLLPGKGKQWERITDTCEALKAMANETGTIVIAVNQAIKDDKLVSRPPKVDEIAGGDATERQVDKLISIYNPEQIANSRYLGILKDRNGGWEQVRQNPLRLIFEVDRGIIREIP